ncbi:hypothetical protein JMN32_11470 [Fulvivirga sp. 29W222]|uniref:Transporter n=1 Tax=Fulvivirga marina TaxID=2494733 RepID=A0A937FXQ6_9BACT|nr:hypothetical protein [Fulvivirga marina]MBL6446932.1 hypothetical protein [Fulvivirga marina]
MNRLIKLIPISLLQLCLVITVKAQDAGDFSATVLDMSRTYLGGSARMQGLGGAQTSLGGDISSASSNPAGLGFFNRSEFSFSPTLNVISSSSDYLESSVNDSKLNLNFANLGVVLNKTKGDLVESKWRGGSFGLSLNRIADFQNRITYEGNSYNPVDSNGDIVLDANHPKDFIEYTVLSSGIDGNGNLTYNGNSFVELAYETYLIDVFPISATESIVDRDIYATDENGALLTDNSGNPIYIPAFPELNYPTKQREVINSKGGIYQTSISYGGNYNDRVYFGAGIGILSIDRDVERIYTEEPTQATLRRLTLIDNYNISGIGINATFGIIARPLPFLLLGTSYTTPSYYGMEQTQETILQADYTSSTDYRNAYHDWTITYEPFNYNISTPSRISAGATFFFGKIGFISTDIERVNYSGAKLNNGDDGFTFSDYNQVVDQFESAFNYRLGTEFRFDMFRVRAGFNYLGDPTDDNIDNSESKVSIGGGMRTKDFFVDLGIVNSLGRNSTIMPYPGASVAEVENTNTTATISVGFFF